MHNISTVQFARVRGTEATTRCRLPATHTDAGCMASGPENNTESEREEKRERISVCMSYICICVCLERLQLQLLSCQTQALSLDVAKTRPQKAASTMNAPHLRCERLVK